MTSTHDSGSRVRLDLLLARRGLFESRSKAAASVMAGGVIVGDGSVPATKPGTLVRTDVVLSIKERARFVSRGGSKLDTALTELGVPVAGERCLDAGASTGGFTDCLLQAGAAHVIALDVAYGELHWSLRRNSRVTVVERTNARHLEPGSLPFRPSLIVADLSFIGLAKVLPVIAACGTDRLNVLALVKPQFELERERVGKGGVVRDAQDRLDALVAVGGAARAAGLEVFGYCESGLPGPAGNRESFIWCGRQTGRGVDDLREAALVAEPGARAA